MNLKVVSNRSNRHRHIVPLRYMYSPPSLLASISLQRSDSFTAVKLNPIVEIAAEGALLLAIAHVARKRPQLGCPASALPRSQGCRSLAAPRWPTPWYGFTRLRGIVRL